MMLCRLFFNDYDMKIDETEAHLVGNRVGMILKNESLLHFNMDDMFGVSDFINIPNSRRVAILIKRKKVLDTYWNKCVDKLGLEEIMDTGQIYKDFYLYNISQYVRGDKLSDEQKIRVVDSLLGVLDVDNEIDASKHSDMMANNDKYVDYMNNWFVDRDEHCSMFWRLLFSKKFYENTINEAIRFAEEYAKFYNQIGILLIDMKMIEGSIADSVTRVSRTYTRIINDVNNSSETKFIDIDNEELINPLVSYRLDKVKLKELIG